MGINNKVISLNIDKYVKNVRKWCKNLFDKSSVVIEHMLDDSFNVVRISGIINEPEVLLGENLNLQDAARCAKESSHYDRIMFVMKLDKTVVKCMESYSTLDKIKLQGMNYRSEVMIHFDNEGLASWIDKFYIKDVLSRFEKLGINICYAFTRQCVLIKNFLRMTNRDSVIVQSILNKESVFVFQSQDKINTVLSDIDMSASIFKDKKLTINIEDRKLFYSKFIAGIDVKSEIGCMLHKYNILSCLGSDDYLVSSAKTSFNKGFRMFVMYVFPVIFLSFCKVGLGSYSRSIKAQRDASVVLADGKVHNDLTQALLKKEKDSKVDLNVYYKRFTDPALVLMNCLINIDQKMSEKTGISQNFIVEKMNIKNHQHPTEKNLSAKVSYKFSVDISGATSSGVGELLDLIRKTEGRIKNITFKNRGESLIQLQGDIAY
ncbi:MAG: hypothetical protein KAH32_02405 [Chlamydiia bacterium]|nr:hypothetical protein [Chlamydiia bacterium]